jgi:hypothetical protein
MAPLRDHGFQGVTALLVVFENDDCVLACAHDYFSTADRRRQAQTFLPADPAGKKLVNYARRVIK